MHLCLVSFHAVLVTFLVVQYYYVNEVGAEKHKFSVDSWFNSMEKKVDIQFPNDAKDYNDNASVNGMMNGVIQRIKKTANEFVDICRRLIQQASTNGTYNKTNHEYDKFSGLVKIQELADFNAMTAFDASDVTNENDTEQETLKTEIIEKQEAPKKKRKGKKHKKKKAKHELEQNSEQHQHKTDGSDDKDQTEYKREFNRKPLKKEHKKKFIKRKFEKMPLKESNNSESDEVKRKKPVDIIVHIKMNE